MRSKPRKRIRRSTKYLYLAIAVFLIAFSVLHFSLNKGSLDGLGKKTEQVYSYTNKFNYDYNVNLISNNFTDGMDLTDKSLAYITALINNIQLKLNYEYKGDKKTDLIYDYKIIGKMQAVYTKDGEEQKILEKEETLVEKTEQKEFSDKLNILENIELDLKLKNSLLNDLKQKAGINFVATYSIMFKINVKTAVDGEDVLSNYAPIITIDLAEKTTKIKGENNLENTQYIAKQIPIVKNSSNFIIDIIAIVVALIIFRYVFSLKVTNRVRNEYKHELNRLLKLCQDKIVKVNTKPDENSENVVIVKDFGEIVKLSEELFKPILCYIDEEKDVTWFTVMSNNVDYRYILRK